MNYPVFFDMTSYFTPEAQHEFDELLKAGIEPDLAFALIDAEVLEGKRKETEVYQIEDVK